MVQGGKWPEVSAKLGLTRDRAVQIFEKALEKLEAMPDELERKDMIIEELKEEINDLKEMKEEKQRLENLTPEEKELLLTPISSDELSVRCQNGLKAAEINNLYDLLRRSHADMLKLRNFGKKSLAELEAWLTSKGLAMKQD
jgi:DNA-directed RNA polymerase subunit alpha